MEVSDIGESYADSTSNIQSACESSLENGTGGNSDRNGNVSSIFL